ncbi:MAG: hypothetical protein COW01_12005 [Bdellovibrionales bacterium CG12_big_fil_rev_8_21_14_0_65_38_15]|nr:MAG: hypothetical protein COW79_01235 [Bdellovibrionales bacterium CG22_combo_CG10-13_8_21_14_all_38_13]PIQ54057.1 MAG: hypothetical protein COW01_12005 [Bdellovibrionales bacterium CG12_big_fil_rev_8_21_14_0_65_38_15]PIR28582.1 MAG: hypothetical protein COV38_15005 [Bdellovibrionales bacterium CG11_big_fil_rev_8_21_14_0_20_38_13]
MERLKQLILRGDKILRGSYNYYRFNNIYSEETFEVYRDRQDFSMSYYADIHSRVATGELLTVNVDVKLNKDFVPSFVKVVRSLGKDFATETYTYQKATSTVLYTFDTANESEEAQIPISSKFHVATPAACSSMVYLKSKKEDTTSKNLYHLIQTDNKWKFEAVPQVKIIAMQRVGTGTENVVIDGHSVQATHYRLFEDNNDIVDNPQALKVHISKHATIPYIIKSDDGTRIQIKFLNDLDKD